MSSLERNVDVDGQSEQSSSEQSSEQTSNSSLEDVSSWEPQDLGQLLSADPDIAAQVPNLDILEVNPLGDAAHFLSSVHKLTLYNKVLNSLPDSIGQLVSLQKLDLANNELSALPDSIGQLVSLQELLLDYNKLSALPDSIGQLVSLQELYLADNKLSDLPESIGNLTSLQADSLQLRNNPLMHPPLEVCSQGVAAIARFLAAGREQTYSHCPFVRWMFVGYEGVGKTSLCKVLRGEDFNSEEVTTNGVGVFQKLFGSLGGLLRGQASQSSHGHSDLLITKISATGPIPLETSCWDFAGQDPYYATHQLFLSQRSIYLLPWKCGAITKPENIEQQLVYWLTCLECRCGPVDVLVVGTHSSCLSEDELSFLRHNNVWQQLRERFQRLRLHVWFVDSSGGPDDQNIQKLREKLLELSSAQARKLEVPRKWIELRSHLQELEDSAESGEGPPRVPLSHILRLKIPGTYLRCPCRCLASPWRGAILCSQLKRRAP